MTTPTVSGHASDPCTNPAIIDWVDKVADLTTPDTIVWCDGSDDEWRRLTTLLVDKGTFVRLSTRPNSFWCASDPEDVARVEDRTFICSQEPSDAGPTNNWMDPGRHEDRDDRGVSRRDGRAHHVCDRVLHGAAGCCRTQVRGTDHRLGLRRGLHADHDPLRHPGVAQPRQRRRLRPLPALGRRTPVPWTRRRAVAVRPHQVHHPLSRGAHDLELRLRLRRQRAARQEMLLRCGSRRRWPATRAGWPSTCSS